MRFSDLFDESSFCFAEDEDALLYLIRMRDLDTRLGGVWPSIYEEMARIQVERGHLPDVYRRLMWAEFLAGIHGKYLRLLFDEVQPDSVLVQTLREILDGCPQFKQ